MGFGDEIGLSAIDPTLQGVISTLLQQFGPLSAIFSHIEGW